MLGEPWGAVHPSCWLWGAVLAGWGTVLGVGVWEVAVEV